MKTSLLTVALGLLIATSASSQTAQDYRNNQELQRRRDIANLEQQIADEARRTRAAMQDAELRRQDDIRQRRDELDFQEDQRRRAAAPRREQPPPLQFDPSGRPVYPPVRTARTIEDVYYNRALLNSYADALDAYNARQAAPRTTKTNDQLFEAQVERSKEKALKYYPSAGVEGSPLAKRMIQIADSMEASGNPIVFSSDAPWKIAQLAASQLGIVPQDAR